MTVPNGPKIRGTAGVWENQISALPNVWTRKPWVSRTPTPDTELPKMQTDTKQIPYLRAIGDCPGLYGLYAVYAVYAREIAGSGQHRNVLNNFPGTP